MINEDKSASWQISDWNECHRVVLQQLFKMRDFQYVMFFILIWKKRNYKVNEFLTNVARLGRRQLEPLRLPTSIGGLASGDSLFPSISRPIFAELSGVSNIIGLSIFQIEAIFLFALSCLSITKVISQLIRRNQVAIFSHKNYGHASEGERTNFVQGNFDFVWSLIFQA